MPGQGICYPAGYSLTQLLTFDICILENLEIEILINNNYYYNSLYSVFQVTPTQHLPPHNIQKPKCQK